MRSLFALVSLLLALCCAAAGAQAPIQFIPPPDVNLSTGCLDALKKMAEGTYPDEVSMLLAWGRGLLDFGAYDDCQDLPDAHYCLALVPGSLPVPSMVGTCIPINCTTHDFNSSIVTFLGPGTFLNSTGAKGHCVEKTDTLPLTAGGVVFAVFLALLGGAALIGTGIEYYLERPQRKAKREESDEGISPLLLNAAVGDEVTPLAHEALPVVKRRGIEALPKALQIFAAFSVIGNFRKLVQPVHPSNRHLESLNGIRVLSMLWVILGHTMFFGLSTMGNIAHVFLHLTRQWPFQIMFSAVLAVDTFFFMSGFLVVYFALKELKQKGRLSWLLYYLHRFWRLTPVVAVIIGVIVLILPAISNGPMWPGLSGKHGIIQPCVDYWWATLLYINNFYPNWGDGCVSWTWYLANDMQFYIITPFFILAYYKSPRIGVLIVDVLLVASIVTTGAITYVNHYTISSLDNNPDLGARIYEKPYTRMSPYLIGILCAYLLIWLEDRKKNGREIKFRLWHQAIAFAVASFLMGSAVFAPLPSYETQGSWTWSDPKTLLYASFFRPIWAVGLGILSLLTFQSYLGWLNDFLSFSVWVPLARLSFGAYLLHPIIQVTAYTTSKMMWEYDYWNVSLRFFGFAVVSYFVSLLMFLTVERPLMNLEKLIFPHRATK